jgi:hypothetical protein
MLASGGRIYRIRARPQGFKEHEACPTLGAVELLSVPRIHPEVPPRRRAIPGYHLTDAWSYRLELLSVARLPQLLSGAAPGSSFLFQVSASSQVMLDYSFYFRG